MFVSDKANWALDEVANELRNSLGGQVTSVLRSRLHNPKSSRVFLSPDIFLQSQKFASLSPWGTKGFLNFFHGGPSDGVEFSDRFLELLRVKDKIRGIRVTNSDIADQLEASQLSKNIAIIPLGVEINQHSLRSETERVQFRSDMNIPLDAMIIGSFQKDGAGWDDGDIPKLEKGPDILVDTLLWLRKSGVTVHALLTGPSRGYVTNRLSQESIPFTYLGFVELEEVKQLYGFIDCYLVSSRLEGGPRAILETLASGRPVVSTKVGQASQILFGTNFGRVVDSLSAEDLGVALIEQMNTWDDQVHPQLARLHASSFENIRAVSLWRQFLAAG